MTDALTGVVLVTHGGAGAAMLAAVGRLVGEEPVAGFVAVEIRSGQSRQDIERALGEAVATVDRGSGVLLVCDLHGSTPSNCAAHLVQNGRNVAAIYGVNLPMLVKLASISRAGVDPEVLAKAAAETAIRSIRVEGRKP
jgi:mannose PTS system EIIA component